MVIKSIALKPIQKALIIIFSGALTGAIVWLILYLLNPNSWKIFTNANGFINGLTFIILGFIMSSIYYLNQFKKLDTLTVKVNDDIHVQAKTFEIDYQITALKHVTLDMQFYYLFNLRRINLYFEDDSVKKLKIISLILPKETAIELKNSLRTLYESTKKL
jgi:hypothetical protein